jgi:hypothetical protein
MDDTKAWFVMAVLCTILVVLTAINAFTPDKVRLISKDPLVVKMDGKLYKLTLLEEE